MSNEARAAVAALLSAANIRITVSLVARGVITPRDGLGGSAWEHDLWRVSIANNSAAFTLDYRTGIGHRKTKKPMSWNSVHSPRELERWNRETAVPVAPNAADVLHCVISDDTRGASFGEWCGDLGYDEDSIKARDTYHLCQKQTDDARRVLGRDLFAALADALQDY